jgi:hypothetical protein
MPGRRASTNQETVRVSESRAVPPGRGWCLPALLSAGLAAAACGGTPGPEAARLPGRGSVAEVDAGRATGPLQATSFEEALRTGSARVAFLYVPASGFAYHDNDGDLTGVTVELLRDFARWVAATHAMHLGVDWLEEPRWPDFYGHVRGSAGGVFGIGNVTITEARRDELDFSPPYLNNIAVLVTHADVPELPSLEDVGTAFAGLTALPFAGTLHEARLDEIRRRWMPEMRVRAVASNDEIVDGVAGGGHFGYVDVYNYWRATQAGLPLRRHAAGDDASEQFGVIMPHGSDWSPVIRAFLEADGGYVRGERYRDLLRSHLGAGLAELLLRGGGR